MSEQHTAKLVGCVFASFARSLKREVLFAQQTSLACHQTINRGKEQCSISFEPLTSLSSGLVLAKHRFFATEHTFEVDFFECIIISMNLQKANMIYNLEQKGKISSHLHTSKHVKKK
jgi:hypothetical protein